MNTTSNKVTPKEKAWELWNYYGTLLSRYDKASEAAIRVVNEVHDVCSAEDIRYWDDVKVELNKLS
jgi:hypothetical protein